MARDYLSSWFNSFLMTSGRDKYGRLRVDVAQTGFFEGREFRTFKELNIPQGQTVVMRINVPVNTILQSVGITLDAGSVKLRTVSGGTPVGSFASNLPIIPKNTMTGTEFPAPPLPLYVAQNTINYGATGLTGGVDIDVIRLVVANASGQASSVGSAQDDSRGLVLALIIGCLRISETAPLLVFSRRSLKNVRNSGTPCAGFLLPAV